MGPGHVAAKALAHNPAYPPEQNHMSDETDSLISWLPDGQATYSKQDNGLWSVVLWRRGTVEALNVLGRDMDKGVACFMAIRMNETISRRTPPGIVARLEVNTEVSTETQDQSAKALPKGYVTR